MVTSDKLSTLILSKKPFKTVDIQQLVTLSHDLGYELAILPGQQPSNKDLRAVIAADSMAKLANAVAGRSLNYNPPTDNSPYFFNMLQLGNLIAGAKGGSGVLSGNLTATWTLIALLGALSFLCLITIVVPLLLRSRVTSTTSSLRDLFPAMLFFCLIGAGFMFTEIGLIQKLSVFLGHPVYAIGILLFTMILSAGIGSILSDRLPLKRNLILGLPVISTVAITLVLIALSGLLISMATSSMAERIFASIATIAPIGLLLGIFFPVGMRLARLKEMPETPWFWALNGVFGVLASALAVFVAIYSSISTNFFIGSACYFLLVLPLISMLPHQSET